MARPAIICDCGDHAFLALTRGWVALVSPQDKGIAERCWLADPRKDAVYAFRRDGPHGRQRRQYMHRVIAKPDAGQHVDHKNRDGIDNRRPNLRPVSCSHNLANSKARGGSSQFKGVSRNKRLGRWHAYITVNGKRRHLGFHDDEHDAARAYDAAAVAAFGEHALTNETLNLFGASNEY